VTLCNGDGEHAQELYREVERKSQEIILLLEKVKQEALSTS